MMVPPPRLAAMLIAAAGKETGLMTTPLDQIDALAATAIRHAAEVHRVTITSSSVSLALVDAILGREASAHPGPQIATLAACYGAWAGAMAVREFGGAWIALAEPVAPRLRIAQRVISPIDIVQRRLLAPVTSPTLTAVFSQLRGWLVGSSAPARLEVLERNRAAWSGPAALDHFAGAAAFPPDRAQATAGLDPWLRAEGVAGKEVLCLGAGGGRHGPLLARAGACVTVVDLSEEQLAHDRHAAVEHHLPLLVLCTSIDDLGALADASFALVVQPVAACYLPDLGRLHREVARVLRPDGLYVVQHKQPSSLQAEALPRGEGYLVRQHYLSRQLLAEQPGATHRDSGTLEFLHTLEELIGGLCHAGFAIEDLSEPVLADAFAPSGSLEHRALFLPPYLKLKARRRG
jgi:SAM-dependent methyltransferase